MTNPNERRARLVSHLLALCRPVLKTVLMERTSRFMSEADVDEILAVMASQMRLMIEHDDLILDLLAECDILTPKNKLNGAAIVNACTDAATGDARMLHLVSHLKQVFQNRGLMKKERS
jgi:hypothetical protein